MIDYLLIIVVGLILQIYKKNGTTSAAVRVIDDSG
jgi:hypothetical protein